MRTFEPNAVLIRESAVWKNAVGEVNVDPELCTLLYLDGNSRSGELWTKEAWEAEAASCYRLRDGMYYRLESDGSEVELCRAGLSISDQEPVPYPCIQLLPEMWVLKRDETEYWDSFSRDEVGVKRVFGVYVLNKKTVVYLCELTPSYALHQMDSQYEPAWDDSVEAEIGRHEKAKDWIRDGDEQNGGSVTYLYCSAVEKMLAEQVLRPHAGDLPKGRTGGYRWVGLKAVTEEEALEEIREATNNGDL